MATNQQFQREHRYWVVKKKDADLYLTPAQRQQLAELVDIANSRRIDAELGSLECVVVESDWPIYGQTWDAVQRLAEGLPPLVDEIKADLQQLINAAQGVLDADDMDDEEDIATMFSNLNRALIAATSKRSNQHGCK